MLNFCFVPIFEDVSPPARELSTGLLFAPNDSNGSSVSISNISTSGFRSLPEVVRRELFLFPLGVDSAFGGVNSPILAPLVPLEGGGGRGGPKFSLSNFSTFLTREENDSPAPIVILIGSLLPSDRSFGEIRSF